MSQSVQPPVHAAAPFRVAGHFGELLQGRLGPEGPLALVSLPCPALWIDCQPQARGDNVLINDHQFKTLCQALGVSYPRHRPHLVATMPPGGGAGSSTGGLVALARALGFASSPDDLARLCVAIEGASDPLMFPNAEQLLFAPRDARILRELPRLPAFEVLGGFVGKAQRTDPLDVEFPDISDLVSQWHPNKGLPHIAALADQSASRTLALRGPHTDQTADIAKSLGALGRVIAHTGNARGFIFATGSVPAHAADALLEAGFDHIVQFNVGGSA